MVIAGIRRYRKPGTLLQSSRPKAPIALTSTPLNHQPLCLSHVFLRPHTELHKYTAQSSRQPSHWKSQRLQPSSKSWKVLANAFKVKRVIAHPHQDMLSMHTMSVLNSPYTTFSQSPLHPLVLDWKWGVEVYKPAEQQTRTTNIIKIRPFSRREFSSCTETRMPLYSSLIHFLLTERWGRRIFKKEEYKLFVKLLVACSPQEKWFQ
jgi:hypothetical protein